MERGRPHDTNIKVNLSDPRAMWSLSHKFRPGIYSSGIHYPKLAIDTSAGEWSSYETRISTFLDLPFIPEPVWQRWVHKLYDYLVDIR
jgi:hypothetical protein